MSFINPIVERQRRRFLTETGKELNPIPQYFIVELSKHPQEWKVSFLVEAICYWWKSKQCPDISCDFPYSAYLSFAESKQSTIRKNLGFETDLMDYNDSYNQTFRKTLTSKYLLLSQTSIKLYELARQSEKNLVDEIFLNISNELEAPFIKDNEE